MSSAAPVVGVDVGGTTMIVALVAESGEILDRVRLPSPAREGGTAVVRELSRLVEQRWPTAPLVGVGAAGVIDPGTGRIVEASATFHSWRGFELRTELSAALGKPVAVINDVNAFLLGEQRHGSAQGQPHCLGIMLGTGVGAAVVLSGTLHQGQHGAAAEIGHMPGFGEEPCTCGGTGHLESWASGRMIARRYNAARGLAGEASGGAVEVARRATAGDAIARQVFGQAGQMLGLAIVQAATLYDLTRVVLGGGVLSSWNWLEPGVQESLTRHRLISGGGIRLLRSTLGSDAVLLGAAALARDEANLKGNDA